MKHWPTKKLGEVAILNPKKSELKDLPDDLLVSFIPMSALDEITQTIKTNELRKLSNVRKGYTYFEEGDILFAKITPCMENGKVAVAKNLKNGIGFGSTEFHVLRPSDKVLSEWIFYIVGSIAFREEAKKHMTGTAGQQRVPIGFLENVKIPLPPLSEQKRIVEKIEKIFAKIDEAERLRAESLAASAALLPSALHQVFSRAKKGKLIKLGEVIKLQGGYAFKSREYQKVGVPIVRIQNLQSENIDLSDAPCISLNQKKELQEYLLEENDILIAMSGATTGKIAIVKKKDLPALLNQRVGRFRIRDHSKISNEFLFWIVRIIQQKIFESAYGAAQPNISGKDIEKFQIPLPPLSEQKKIVAYLDALSQKFQELKKLQQQTAANFSALRQSILAEVFNQK